MYAWRANLPVCGACGPRCEALNRTRRNPQCWFRLHMVASGPRFPSCRHQKLSSAAPVSRRMNRRVQQIPRSGRRKHPLAYALPMGQSPSRWARGSRQVSHLIRARTILHNNQQSSLRFRRLARLARKRLALLATGCTPDLGTCHVRHHFRMLVTKHRNYVAYCRREWGPDLIRGKLSFTPKSFKRRNGRQGVVVVLPF